MLVIPDGAISEDLTNTDIIDTHLSPRWVNMTKLEMGTFVSLLGLTRFPLGALRRRLSVKVSEKAELNPSMKIMDVVIRRTGGTSRRRKGGTRRRRDG